MTGVGETTMLTGVPLMRPHSQDPFISIGARSSDWDTGHEILFVDSTFPSLGGVFEHEDEVVTSVPFPLLHSRKPGHSQFPLTPADFVILFERDLVLRYGTYIFKANCLVALYTLALALVLLELISLH